MAFITSALTVSVSPLERAFLTISILLTDSKGSSLAFSLTSIFCTVSAISSSASSASSSSCFVNAGGTDTYVNRFLASLELSLNLIPDLESDNNRYEPHTKTVPKP